MTKKLGIGLRYSFYHVKMAYVKITTVVLGTNTSSHSNVRNTIWKPPQNDNASAILNTVIYVLEFKFIFVSF